jgi:ABC-type glutathione transport system ATPase component
MAEMQPLLRARGLKKCFHTRKLGRKASKVIALDNVDLDIYAGEVVALIGESGSGKTTCGKALLRLTPVDAGSIVFNGIDLESLSNAELLEKRRLFQMVFQNQSANLHPKMTVMQMMLESIKLHRPSLEPSQRRDFAKLLLERVNLLARAEQRPGSLSGGEKRRVGLARILATQPKLVVADEPTSGLDAAIKLEMIELLRGLKEADMAYLLISHDLGLVRRIADRVLVMLKGQIIEEIDIESLREGRALHPYTRRLLAAADLNRNEETTTYASSEDILFGASEQDGCVYAPICSLARERGILKRCENSRPHWETESDGQRVRCFAVGGTEALQ